MGMTGLTSRSSPSLYPESVQLPLVSASFQITCPSQVPPPAATQKKKLPQQYYLDHSAIRKAKRRQCGVFAK